MSDCGHDHSADRLEHYQRAAEAVVASSSADRATLNAGASSMLAEARETWPDLSDENLLNFFTSQAALIEKLSRMDVMTLVTVLDYIFAGCTLVAASLAGAYDINDNDAPKRRFEDLYAEAKASAAKRMEELNKNTGMFL